LIAVNCSKSYQDDLRTPGIWPDSANSLKQMRQSPNIRMNPRERPHLWHLLCWRTGYLGTLFDFKISDNLAI